MIIDLFIRIESLEYIRGGPLNFITWNISFIFDNIKKIFWIKIEWFYRGRFDIKFFVLNIWYLIYLIYFLIIVLKIIEIFRMIKWSGSIVLYIYIFQKQYFMMLNLIRFLCKMFKKTFLLFIKTKYINMHHWKLLLFFF